MNSTPTDHDFDPSILIVSATQAEARYVPSGARLLVTGIGKMRATAALTRALADPSAPSTRLVVNIGTAGALHDHHAGLFLPSVVVEHDISATELRAMGYPIVDRWVVPDGDGSVLASGDTFVADPVRRASLARQADLVDMEGCAVTYVAAAFDVRCQLVKVVSDGADERAMDWPSLVGGAARLLGDWLADGTL